MNLWVEPRDFFYRSSWIFWCFNYKDLLILAYFILFIIQRGLRHRHYFHPKDHRRSCKFSKRREIAITILLLIVCEAYMHALCSFKCEHVLFFVSQRYFWSLKWVARNKKKSGKKLCVYIRNSKPFGFDYLNAVGMCSQIIFLLSIHNIRSTTRCHRDKPGVRCHRDKPGVTEISINVLLQLSHFLAVT